MAHNLNFHISDCYTLQLRKQKKANSVILENNPLKEQKNLREAWFKLKWNLDNPRPPPPHDYMHNHFMHMDWPSEHADDRGLTWRTCHFSIISYVVSVSLGSLQMLLGEAIIHVLIMRISWSIIAKHNVSIHQCLNFAYAYSLIEIRLFIDRTENCDSF